MIKLDVTFGGATHFRTESMEFEIVDWRTQYHAILGRPAFARFMAVPHYAYLQLKMPGPKGAITVSGNFQRSDACDRDFNKISETFEQNKHWRNSHLSTTQHKCQSIKSSLPTKHSTPQMIHEHTRSIRLTRR